MRSVILLRAAAALSVLVASGVRADDPPPPAPAAAPALAPGALAPAGYPSVDEVRARIREIVKSAGARASLAQIATSREGRAIDALTLGDQDMTKKQPAMLLVAGMDGVNLGSTEQLLGALEAALRDNAKAFDGMRVYAIAQANPDARAWAMANKHPRATNARVVDDDRDGATDEDAPRDVNGDGLVTMIRRVAPPGTTATQVVDAVDPRIVRGANKEKREIATHEVFTEGADRDNDGLVAEDAAGGVDLDRNFPHRWPEFAADAGPFQLSEPEALGIAEFVRAHPEITTAVVFGRHDTLVHFPDTKDKDSTGRTPVAYLAEDHDLYRDFGKAWKESTKIEKSENADLAGSLVLWLADHRGIAAVAANGWARPEVPKPPEPKEDEPKPEAPKETGDAEQSAWLAVSEKIYSAGFAPWTAFKHPTYGDCEIGGFAPFFRESPTIAQARDLATRTAPFLAALAAKRATLDASEPKFTALADGLAKIEFRLVNSGNIATTTEMGRITGVVPPVIVRLVDPSTGKGLSPEAVLSGQPVNKLNRLAASESREFTWIVRLPAGGAVQVATSGPAFDTITRTAKGASK